MSTINTATHPTNNIIRQQKRAQDVTLNSGAPAVDEAARTVIAGQRPEPPSSPLNATFSLSPVDTPSGTSHQRGSSHSGYNRQGKKVGPDKGSKLDIKT